MTVGYPYIDNSAPVKTPLPLLGSMLTSKFTWNKQWKQGVEDGENTIVKRTS